MPTFIEFPYSLSQVKQAGKALRREIIWSEDRREEILEIFKIANSWRETHYEPMNRLRREMSSKMRARGQEGLSLARLKTMRSIRRKLSRSNLELHKVQDLGGCRAVLPSIASVNQLVEAYNSSARHTLFKEDNYIAQPKRGGYRCHHLIYEFKGEGKTEVFDGRRIEVQVRTRLQHSWATAVEAVGLFRKEDMKGGQGDLQWLRLFDLTSAELALAENCPEGAHLPPRRERVAEIKHLGQALDAIGTLDNLRFAVRFIERHRFDVEDPTHYRIEFDNTSRQVRVKPHRQPMTGIHENDAAEQQNVIDGATHITTVFVEADRIEDLMDGYPNYFGDVQVFTANLQAIISDRQAKEFVMPPQETVPMPPKEAPDMSWFRRYKRWN